MKCVRYLLPTSAGIALVLALSVAGCGVKGQPLPPEAVQPARISSLRAQADKEGIKLTWARPELYAKGAVMRDLAGFEVLRAPGDQPLQPLKPLVELPITDRERFQKLKQFDWVDTATEMGHTYRYAVISITDSGYTSDSSNPVAFTRIVPPPPANPENFALPRPTPLR